MRKIFRTPRLTALLIGMALVLVTLLAYGQVKDHRFITWDDDYYVTENPMVKAGLCREGVAWAFTATHAANWHPLTWLSLMLDCQIYGLQPRGFHLTNLFFHLVNTVLWFLFFARVTGNLWPSALVAALFALHPLHVESVAWVAERKDVLSTFWWVATLGAYAWYVQRPGLARYLPIPIFLALGLMAKPMLVTLPLVLLLLDYWPLGRFPLGPPPAGPGTGASRLPPLSRARVYWRLIGEKIPLLALSALSAIVTVMAQRWDGAVWSLTRLSLSERLANALVAYLKYLGKMFWPFPMVFFYPFSPVPGWQAAGAGLLLLGVSAVVLWRARPYPYLPVGWLWFLGTLVPVIGLVQVGGQALADRYTYVPFIGLFIIIAWGARDLTARWRHPQICLSVAAGVVLLACFLATWVQVGYWRDSESLFHHALKVDENNYMAYNNLGMALSNQGRFPEAISRFSRCIRLKPSYAHAYNNLGVAYARQGKWPQAIEFYQQAIQVNPRVPVFFNNLALVYQQQGKTQEAATTRERAQRCRR
jgi:hypothetical protein